MDGVQIAYLAYLHGHIEVDELERALEDVLWHDKPLGVRLIAAAYGHELPGTSRPSVGYETEDRSH